MILNLFLVVILVSIWTLNSYIKKTVSNKISAEQMILIISFFAFTLIILYALVKQYIMKKDDLYINFLNNKNVDSTIVLKLLGLSLLAFVASNINIYLLNKNNLSNISPIIHSLEIIFAMIVGYMFLDEKIGINGIIGGILIICGILILNK